MNDWDEEGINPGKPKGPNTSMHDKGIQGTVFKLVDSIKNLTAQLHVVRNETTAVMDELNSMKSKAASTQQQQTNKSANKQPTTKAITNANNKRTKTDASVPSDHDFSDLESRITQTNTKLNSLTDGLSNVNDTLKQLQQMIQSQYEQDDYMDEEEDEQIENNFEAEGDGLNNEQPLIEIDQ
jgi:predicted  nucleic acid-binding Zn-ribbon protein